MKRDKAKYMKIKMDIETGRVVKIVDENGNKAKKVSQKEIIEIYNSKQGFKHLGTMLHTHSSPGCITIIIAGKAFRLCNFPKT